MVYNYLYLYYNKNNYTIDIKNLFETFNSLVIYTRFLKFKLQHIQKNLIFYYMVNPIV